MVASAAIAAGTRGALADDSRVRFDIPRQAVGDALLVFAQQAEIPILLPSDAFNDVVSNPLLGEFALGEALKILLEGTQVAVSINDQPRQLVVSGSAANGCDNNNEGECMALSEGKRRLLATTIAAVVSGGADVANAQQQQPQAREGAPLEEITVTGSRIRQTDGMVSPVPVTSVSTQELASFNPGGTISQQLDSLPQFFGNATLQRSASVTTVSGGSGFSALNLRNLGANRTLTLLDGARVVPTDKRGGVNVDAFPTALIRGVEVVTGGASAAYGADAVGGVVNFVINREFEGFTANIGTGITEQGDGERWNVDMAAGKRFGNLNLIGSMEARKLSEIERDPASLGDWFQRWGHVTNPEWVKWRTANPSAPMAQSPVPQRLTLPWVTVTTHSPFGLISNTRGVMDNMKFTEDGRNITPFVFGDVVSNGGVGTTSSMSGGPEAQLAHMTTGGGVSAAEAVTRSGFLGAKYEFSDTFSTYGQVMVGRTEANDQINRANYELQNPTWYTTIRSDNAFLPDSVRQLMQANNLQEFRMSKFGGFFQERDLGSMERASNVFGMYQWSVGFDWELPNEWLLHGSWQEGQSKRNSKADGRIRIDRLFMAMDAVRDPATGAIVCRVQLFNPSPEQLAASPSIKGQMSARDPNVPRTSPIGLDNSVRDCVPLNIFGSGNASIQSLDYIESEKGAHGKLNQDFAEVLLTGDLFDGWGYGPVGFAAGLTYRDMSINEASPQVELDMQGAPLNAPELGIRGIPPGYTSATSLHQFAGFPPISGSFDVWEAFAETRATLWETNSGQRINGDIAARRSDYSTSGNADSFKLGLDFQVIDSLRLRWTKSRDTREPNFSERLDEATTLGNILDPEFNGARFEITTLNGGNPNLKPEVANTTTVGVVLTPTVSFLEGLRLSVDWYEVKVKDSVSSLGVQRIVDECSQNNVLCDNVIRDPVTNQVTVVLNTFLNAAQAKAEGIDFEGQYSVETDFLGDVPETLNIRGLFGYVIERSDTPFGGAPVDTVGSGTNPEWTGTLTGTYDFGLWSVQMQGRYVDSTMVNTTWVEGIDVDDNTVASMTWWNGRLAYNGEMASGATYSIAFNVQNMFDRMPPVVPSVNTRGGSQSVRSNHEIFGRAYQLSANFRF
jgi:outer membrane receptor protein involved in Fe transport